MPWTDRNRTPCLRALACLCLTAWAAPGPLQADPAPPARHRIVIEVSVPGAPAWAGILNNVENLEKEFGAQDTKIEVVAHGEGLSLLLKTDSKLKERLAKIARQGVVLAACENTMRRKHVTKADLLPAASTVPSGVGEVVRKEEEGWSYLKGGG